MYYSVYEFKNVPDLGNLTFVKVAISETKIKPLQNDDCGGICQNDSTICGHFEGLIEDVEDDGGFVAKCAKRRC